MEAGLILTNGINGLRNQYIKTQSTKCIDRTFSDVEIHFPWHQYELGDQYQLLIVCLGYPNQGKPGGVADMRKWGNIDSEGFAM